MYSPDPKASLLAELFLTLNRDKLEGTRRCCSLRPKRARVRIISNELPTYRSFSCQRRIQVATIKTKSTIHPVSSLLCLLCSLACRNRHNTPTSRHKWKPPKKLLSFYQISLQNKLGLSLAKIRLSLC